MSELGYLNWLKRLSSLFSLVLLNLHVVLDLIVCWATYFLFWAAILSVVYHNTDEQSINCVLFSVRLISTALLELQERNYVPKRR